MPIIQSITRFLQGSMIPFTVIPIIKRQKEFINLCDNLNIELHNNTLKNDGQNAHNVLGDFLKLIKQV